MKTKKQLLMSGLALALAFTACKKDTPNPNNNTTSGAYSGGVFVTCEGLYGTGSGTVSFYNRTSGAVSNDIYMSANSSVLGNVVQSMSIYNSKGYVVVNNAGKVEVVNQDDFKAAGTITGLNMPRYFLGISTSKGYISEWGSTGTNGAIRVVNLSNNTISKTINIGSGTEKMLAVNNFVFVTNAGGFSNDSIVKVIDTNMDTLEASIQVGPNPTGIVSDVNGKIWVLCGGQWNGSYTALAQTGKLVRINPVTYTVEQTFIFSSTSSMPSSLTINTAKNKLYYSYLGAVYEMNITASNLSSTALINRSFYSLGIDPSNDYIYAGDAGNYSSNGKVIRFNSSTGAKVDSFAVGIIPGNFFFK